jgi:bacteriocin-like protein
MSNELNAIELNDAELAQIQGGGFFSDVVEAVKKGAEAIAKGFTNGAIAEIKRRISRWF